jgi:hypothetical protein
MPKTGSINAVSRIDRSNCCGHERALTESHRFPACGSSCEMVRFGGYSTHQRIDVLSLSKA